MAKDSNSFAIFLLVVGAVLAAFFFGSHGFSVSVPLQVEVAQGSTTHTSIIVQPGFFYIGDVSLKAKSVPPHISVNFEPNLVKSQFTLLSMFNFNSLINPTSTLNISADKKTPPGEYWIIVESVGSVGKYDSMLTIKVTK